MEIIHVLNIHRFPIEIRANTKWSIETETERSWRERRSAQIQMTAYVTNLFSVMTSRKKNKRAEKRMRGYRFLLKRWILAVFDFLFYTPNHLLCLLWARSQKILLNLIWWELCGVRSHFAISTWFMIWWKLKLRPRSVQWSQISVAWFHFDNEICGPSDGMDRSRSSALWIGSLNSISNLSTRLETLCLFIFILGYALTDIKIS